MMDSKKIIVILVFVLVFVSGCQKGFRGDDSSGRDDWEREKAFPDMSWESSSPRRKASLQLTKEGVEDSKRGFQMRAMKKYEKAIDIDPTNPYPYYHYGVARLNAKNYQQSIRLMEEAKHKFSGNYKWLSRIYTFQGLSYKGMGEADRAKQCFKKAVDLDEKNVRAWEALEKTENEY